jgi:hypothetical protein
MAEQNYANHRRFDPMFHGVLFGLLMLTLIGSLVNLYRSIGDHQRIYSASLIAVLAICSLLLSVICRVYALKAQDRAIRAEENLRHFVLTGKLLDPALTVPQVVALRFASDSEFAALAGEAAAKNLPPDDIKRAVKNWKADTYRV